MKVFTHSEPGGKEVNEDFLIVTAHPQRASLQICCLADGQGGRSNGAAAARAGCEVYAQNAAQVSPESLLTELTHEKLLALVDGTVSKTGGFTTFIGLIADGSHIRGGSSGDSKIYVRHPAGEITEISAAQRKNPPVGSGIADFTTFSQDLEFGTRLLMMTDGVWKYAGYAQIEKAFASADFDNAATYLRAETLNRGGRQLPDDFSLIGFEIN